MRPAFYLFFLSFCISNTLLAQPTAQFEHFSMGGINSAEFTTNNFKCIAVGKGDKIWAGSQYGGLYIYSDSFNIWRKSDKLTNVFINDIKADPDSGIWIAQSGQQTAGGNSNIQGGLNYFRLATDIVMEFYSVAGTTTDAHLNSRNAKAVYLDTSYKASRGRLPRPWVAQGTYITSFNARKGGLNVGLNATSPFLSNVLFGFAIFGNPLHICEAVAGNSSEVWVASRVNQGGSKIIRYTPDKDFIGYIQASNTPVFTEGFAAQAMLFDSRGNKWVGLKSGGLRILKDTTWYTMNSPTFFDVNTQVNFNAMVEDEYGNIYIGTTSGLLKYNAPDYNATSSPENSGSYELYTDLEGLLNNNVTGLAYDKKNGKVLITSPSGVTFMKTRQPNISGVVFNVHTAVDSTNNPYLGLQKKPFRTTQDVRAYLLKDGVEKEMVYPDADGKFELIEANETDNYTVEVRYNREGKTMKFVYNNIKNHTLLKPTLVPDSLIGEIKDMVGKLEKRCFPVKLYFNIELPELFCTERLGADNAFNTSNSDAPYQPYYNPAGISTDFDKRINNLANYYASLASVYKIGGQASDLVIDGTAGFLDLLEALVGTVKFKIEMSKPGNKDALEAMDEDVKAGLIGLAGAIKDGANFILNKGIKYFITDADTKKVAENCVSALTEVADLVIAGLSDGATSGTLMKALLDNAKKLIAVETSIRYYKSSYAQTRHENFVSTASSSATSLQSDLSYVEAYQQLYHPAQNSLGKRTTESYNDYKTIISVLGDVAKMADVATGLANAATILVVIPGGQAIAVAAKQLSFVCQLAKLGAVGGQSISGFLGASAIAKRSDSILVNTNLQRVFPVNNNTNFNNSGLFSRLATDSLIARKTRYNNRLTEIRSIYTAGTFNTAAFITKRKQLKLEDSLFTAELKVAVNSLLSASDSAAKYIPLFKEKMDKAVDTFVADQIQHKQAYFFENISFIYEPNRTVYAASIDSLLDKIIMLNDSAVNYIAGLLEDVNNSTIAAQGFIMQENYSIVFSRVPGSNGTVTYSFRNYGAAPVNNVSFKLKGLTAGYTILSADSINVGNILPGQLKQVSYTFKSPLTDSIGNYVIEIKSNNVKYNDIFGLFYAIDPAKCYSLKDGNWNDPSVWSCGQVPVATNPVQISHKITVTAAAACKNVTLGHPGDLKINNGISFNIAQ